LSHGLPIEQLAAASRATSKVASTTHYRSGSPGTGGPEQALRHDVRRAEWLFCNLNPDNS